MPRPDLSMTRADVLALLEEGHTGVLSTLDRHGYPHSVGIYYVPVADGARLELQTWVYAKSQKAVNVARDPRASLLVEHGEPYVDLRGALVRGSARVERDPDLVLDLGKKIYDRYFLPRTRVPLEEGPLVDIERQARKRAALIIVAERVASWDHSRARS